jgi:molecular chaperone GrpE
MEELNEQQNENKDVNENENGQTGFDESLKQIETELKIAQEKNIELEKQLNEYKDSYLRKVAEFENYKRRVDNEQSNILKYAAEHFIKNILPVYDDLERSLNHIGDESSFESLKKGLELVYDKFTKTLNNQGIKQIDAKGKPFDVDLHEALMQQPVEGIPPHTVLDVIEQGYVYKDKVLRHAKVIVSAETISTEEKNNSKKEINKESKYG